MYGGFPNKNLFLNSVPRKKINKLSLNGRSSLAMIIIAKKIKKIYIPFYICEEVIKTIKVMNVEYEFYSINKNLKPKFKYNSLIKNGLDGTQKLIILGVSVILWIIITEKWKKEII